MSREIRLPAPHPQFVARRPGGQLRADHPGTAVRFNGELFEVTRAAQAGPEWVYTLEPWDDAQTIRTLVEWDPHVERRFVEGARLEKAAGRKGALAWRLQALLGFLPASHQERLNASIGLDPGRATFWSAVLECAAGLPLAVLFVVGRYAGMMGGAGGEGRWEFLLNLPAWLGVLAILAVIEGGLRLVLNLATGDPMGSVPFNLLDLRLKDPAKDDLMSDDYTVAGEFFIARTPVPKPWWETPGGVVWEGEPYRLLECKRIHMSYLYRFGRLHGGGDEAAGFAPVDPVRERVRNVASDRAFVLAPLWGYLPPAMQARLETLGRYRPLPFVRLSIGLNLAMAVPIVVADLWAFAIGAAGVWNGLRFLFGLFLLQENLLRLYRLLRDRAVTGSFLAFLVKPVYYMAFREGLD